MFKAKKKKGLTPDKNHYTSDTFVEAVKNIANVLKLSNLNNHIQTLIRVKERKVNNYPKGKISSLLTLIKEKLLSLHTCKITSKKLSVN